MPEEILQIKEGDTAIIKLESLAASGYLWDYAIDDDSIVQLEKKNSELQSTHLSGHSGMEIFSVKGLKKGIAKIHFSQSRKWEQKIAPIKNKYYTVKVD